MGYTDKIETFLQRKFEILDRVIEAGVYLFIFFLFLTKGEGIRNILLFSNFSLWLVTLRYRKNRSILIEPVPLLYGGFIISVLISVVFSIDILYSFKELEGDFLKSLLFFPVLSTVLSDKKRLKRFVYVSIFLLIFIVSNGFYSYLVYNMPVMMSETPLRHAFHNRFAIDLNTFLPFLFALFLISKKKTSRILLSTIIMITIIAIIMSASRGGFAAFLFTFFVWLIYSFKKRANLLPVIGGIIIVFICSGILSFFFIEGVKERLLRTKHDYVSINKRVNAWIPLLYSVKERPVFGWGYGNEIFRMDLPFEKTPFKESPYKKDIEVRDPHNNFLGVLFNQGIVGFILYLALLIIATKTFWSNANSPCNLKNYILISCTSVLIGTYFIHGLSEVLKFRYLTLILGIGIAAQNLQCEDTVQ